MMATPVRNGITSVPPPTAVMTKELARLHTTQVMPQKHAFACFNAVETQPLLTGKVPV